MGLETGTENPLGGRMGVFFEEMFHATAREEDFQA